MRIIPARAGFTVPQTFVHPLAQGSSPLARGLQFWLRYGYAMNGIIPARAGFTRQY